MLTTSAMVGSFWVPLLYTGRNWDLLRLITFLEPFLMKPRFSLRSFSKACSFPNRHPVIYSYNVGKKTPFSNKLWKFWAKKSVKGPFISGFKAALNWQCALWLSKGGSNVWHSTCLRHMEHSHSETSTELSCLENMLSKHWPFQGVSWKK